MKEIPYPKSRLDEPATELQLLFISRLGFDVTNVEYTKKMCMDIISSQPASEVQKKEMRNFADNLTIGQAQLFFKTFIQL